jgi:hypothetical protein
MYEVNVNLLADFGLSRRIKDANSQNYLEKIPYLLCWSDVFCKQNDNQYSLNEKSNPKGLREITSS